jgi:hypothetical protein
VEDVVRDPVAVVLDGLDLTREVLALREVAEHLDEQLGRPHQVAGGFLEEVEELLVLGDEDLGQAGHDREHGPRP